MNAHRIARGVTLTAALTALAACASAGTPRETAGGPTAAPASPAAVCRSQRGSAAWADCVVAHMTPSERAAQMVWPWLTGDYVAGDSPEWQRLLGYVRDDQVGGLIMSVGSPLEIAAKLNALQGASPLPLLVASDLETGAGFRARGGYFLPNGIYLGGATVFPPQMALGATGDTAFAYALGSATAVEGRALGIQVAFAPVLDVNNNPANPVINTRSFGEDPHAVARMGRAFIDGLQAHGMIATGKHFPGHGDTDVNSHLALPVVTASRARLDTVELVPFRAAIAAGVGAMMTFHGDMPALDSSGVPGTLSPLVLTGLLRHELGFRGLVVTDAMDMRGVTDRFGASEALKRAVAAGADVLLMPADVPGAITAVLDGIHEGRYTQARVDSSARHILAVKEELGLDRRRLVNLDSARAVVGDTAHEALARLIAERSITLVKDSLGQLPVGRLPRDARVLSVTYARRADLEAGVAFDAELRARFPALRTAFVDAGDTTRSLWPLLSLADSASVVLVSSYLGAGSAVTSVAAPGSFAGFLAALVTRGAKPVLVAFGNPYLLQQVPEVPAYVVAWGPFPVSQRAAARAVLGVAPITGRLPIRIPGAAALGAGESRPLAASATP